MVYHRSDSSSMLSSDARRQAEVSRTSSSQLEEEEYPKPRDSYDENRSDSSRFSDSSKHKEGRFSETSRPRNGRDEGPRYPRSSRSRDDKDDGRYFERSRSRDDRKEGSRDRDSRYYEGSRYSDRQRYRDSPRFDNMRYNEGPRHLESSRYSDRYSRYLDDPRYIDEVKYLEDSRYDEVLRYPEDSRYVENSRFRGGRGEEWYRESYGRYIGSRFDDESRYSGENSRQWRGRDLEAVSDDDDDDDPSVASRLEKEKEMEKEREREKEKEKEKLKNAFQNDGSFLEMFKKMQEANKPPETQEGTETSTTVVADGQQATTSVQESIVKRPALSMVGKRRGGRVLPTGMVKKLKREEEEEETPKDAWSLYMAEVRKYKEASCEEEGKTRPLVK